jgi:hypothetical protein
MKNRNWTDRIVWIGTVTGSILFILTITYNFGLKTTLAKDFVSVDDHDKIIVQLEKRFQRLESQDAAIGRKIDKIFDKIEGIYQILIKLN